MAKKSTRREPSSPAQENLLQAEECALVEPKPWEMPQPNRGQIVIFYHRATVSENNADIAHVMRVGERSIEVAFRGQGYSEVLHKDDDRLLKNPDLRMDVDGVWDFTEEKKHLDISISKLEERITELENK
tara:strand:- start:257 stop:646 length:390 start_codon:yes stop_codon:yes gene_type:complete